MSELPKLITEPKKRGNRKHNQVKTKNENAKRNPVVLKTDPDEQKEKGDSFLAKKDYIIKNCRNIKEELSELVERVENEDQEVYENLFDKVNGQKKKRYRKRRKRNVEIRPKREPQDRTPESLKKFVDRMVDCYRSRGPQVTSTTADDSSGSSTSEDELEEGATDELVPPHLMRFPKTKQQHLTPTFSPNTLGFNSNSCTSEFLPANFTPVFRQFPNKRYQTFRKAYPTLPDEDDLMRNEDSGVSTSLPSLSPLSIGLSSYLGITESPAHKIFPSKSVFNMYSERTLLDSRRSNKVVQVDSYSGTAKIDFNSGFSALRVAPNTYLVSRTKKSVAAAKLRPAKIRGIERTGDSANFPSINGSTESANTKVKYGIQALGVGPKPLSVTALYTLQGFGKAASALGL